MFINLNSHARSLPPFGLFCFMASIRNSKRLFKKQNDLKKQKVSTKIWREFCFDSNLKFMLNKEVFAVDFHVKY